MTYHLASNNILFYCLDIDDCVGVNCQNGGACVDGVDDDDDVNVVDADCASL